MPLHNLGSKLLIIQRLRAMMPRQLRKGIVDDAPVPKIRGHRVTDRNVPVAEFRVAERLGCLEVEDVMLVAIGDQPEVPDPSVVDLQCHHQPSR